MSTPVFKTAILSEAMSKGFVPQRKRDSAANCWILKNHSGDDLNINLKINSVIASVPTPGSLLAINNNNFVFAKENETKLANVDGKTASFGLKKDPSNKLPTFLSIEVRNGDGNPGYYLSSVNGNSLPDEMNISYLYAQCGLGINGETLSAANYSGTDVYSNITIDNKPLVLQYTMTSPSYPPLYFGQVFSIFDNRIPLSVNGLDNVNKRAVIYPSSAPWGNYVNTDVHGYMDKAFVDPNDGITKVNLGYAFRVPGNPKVFNTVITVKAPFDSLDDTGEWVEVTPLFTEALRNNPEFMELPNAEHILAAIMFYAWDNDATALSGGFEGVGVTDYLEAKGSVDPMDLNKTRREEIIVMPEYEITHNGQPVVNLGKDNSPKLAPYLSGPHKEYKIIGISPKTFGPAEELYTQLTYVQTDTSVPVWMWVGYTAATANGKFYIDWGDGTTQTYLASNYVNDGYDIYLEHPYAANGEYVIKIYSDTPVNYIEIGEINKVIDWGDPTNLQLQINSKNLVQVPSTLHPAMTNLKYMFSGCSNFNQDISSWNTANVVDMTGMFRKATIFNQNISSWNTSKVINMASMFERANAFNQDLSQWCVGAIATIPTSFALYAPLFTTGKHPVWGTCPRGENVTPPEANEMYFTTTAGTIDYNGVVGDQIILNDGTTVILENDSKYGIAVPSGKHKVVLVESRSQDYVGLGGVALVEINNFPTLSSVNSFDTCPNNSSPNLIKVPTTLPSNIMYTQYMFFRATSFNQDISMWDVSHVTNMEYMFYGATAFNQPLDNWNVSNVTNMFKMFFSAAAFNRPLNTWNTVNITNMAGMFGSATLFNQPLNNWNTSNVTDMSNMFFYANGFNQDISSWNVSKVTDMSNMFFATNGFNQDISSWNTKSVSNMNYMFSNASAFNQDLSQWCVGLIPTLPSDFAFNAPLFKSDKHPVWGTCPRGEDGTNPIIADNEMYFTTTTGDIFYQGYVGDTITLSDGTSIVIDSSGGGTYTVPAGKHKVKLVTDRSGYLGLDGLALTELNNFPTLSSVTTMDFCPNSSSPNLIKVPTTLPANITSLANMFYGASSFNQDISTWDVSNVTTMEHMFRDATVFNKTLNAWNVSNVTNMLSMFYKASAFNQPIDLWNVGKVTNMNSMFYKASAFNQPLITWDVSEVIDMNSMFNGTTTFDQDLSGWCVARISSLPLNFNLNGIITAGNLPVWGTCPRGENLV